MAHLIQYSENVPVVKFPVEYLMMTIGQNFNADICVPEDGLADIHAKIEAFSHNNSYRFVITSENNQTIRLNDETVSEAELQDGDWLIIGGIEFKFIDNGQNEIKAERVMNNIIGDMTQKIATEKCSQAKIEAELTLVVNENETTAEVMAKKSNVTNEDKHFSRRLRLF